jgi:hypothetical protein
MHAWQRTIVAAAVLCAAAGSSALAQVIVPPNISGVPGPIAGAGLPLLLFAGGYVLIRLRRGAGKDPE